MSPREQHVALLATQHGLRLVDVRKALDIRPANWSRWLAGGRSDAVTAAVADLFGVDATTLQGLGK